MTEIDLTTEQRNILDALRTNSPLKLREMHDELANSDDSRFMHSPEFGDGWNDERWEVREIRDELAAQNLITNDYQDWKLTDEGRKLTK